MRSVNRPDQWYVAWYDGSADMTYTLSLQGCFGDTACPVPPRAELFANRFVSPNNRQTAQKLVEFVSTSLPIQFASNQPTTLGSPTAAQVAQAGDRCPGQSPTYSAGFANLSAQVGDAMGQPVTCEFPTRRGQVMFSSRPPRVWPSGARVPIRPHSQMATTTGR